MSSRLDVRELMRIELFLSKAPQTNKQKQTYVFLGLERREDKHLFEILNRKDKTHWGEKMGGEAHVLIPAM